MSSLILQAVNDFAVRSGVGVSVTYWQVQALQSSVLHNPPSKTSTMTAET